MSTFFQTGTLITFLMGIYDGDCTFEELAKKGNFGLGTLNAVDGEMVAVDGHFYRIDAEGRANMISPSERTPFAVVSWFQSVTPFAIQAISNMDALSKVLDAHIPTPNIFYMIRIDGEFEWIKLRSEKAQPCPYRPLSETLPKLQTIFELRNSSGTLVVTRCPSYSAAMTVPGYHYHYIDKDRCTGGHVFDLTVKSAQVMLNPLHKFEMSLIDSPAFDKANLEIDIQEALKKIE